MLNVYTHIYIYTRIYTYVYVYTNNIYIYIYSVWLHGRYPTVGICLPMSSDESHDESQSPQSPLSPGARWTDKCEDCTAACAEGCITYSVQAVVAILMVLSFPFMAIWFSCIKPLADGFEDWWKRK